MFKTKTEGGSKEQSVYSEKELYHIGDKIQNILEKEFEEYTVEAKPFFDKLIVNVGTKFFEISDVVASAIQDAYQFNDDFKEEYDDMSEDEAEKYFDEAYAEQLQEINEENAVYVNKVVDTPKYTVEFHPLECDGDYCIAGLQAEITFKRRVNDEDIRNIAELIAETFRNN
ncbi:MAG: hypothetical protein JHC26_07985 [Thermofilum sp.]|jgi:Lhr-like helicase|uniref:hypothetical protein n=1 Tax=Thermofilum sp. TaxID=1961369 RepID=UPI00258DD7B0|nr:hypothetical protein [Thermofilum sp.]MCI4409017.1 hypothetical protein [Thermofilum sp.]